MNPVITSFDPLLLIPQADLSVLSIDQKIKIGRDIKNKLGEFIIVSFAEYLVKYELENILDTVGMEGQMKKLESYVPAFPYKIERVIDEFSQKFQENYKK